MTSWSTWAASGTLLLVSLLALACSSTRSEPEATATTPPSPSPTVIFGQGSLSATINALCRLDKAGAQLNVTYRAASYDGAQLNRVRVEMDNQLIHDTGALRSDNYEGVITLFVAPGSPHVVAIVATSPGLAPISSRYPFRCPNPLPHFRV